MHTLQTILGLLVLTSALTLDSIFTKDDVARKKYFYVRTKLVEGQTKTEYDGLWLESFHTQAGTSAATFSHSLKYAIKGFLNDSFLVFPLDEPKFPAQMYLEYPQLDDYSGWFSTAIDSIRRGSKGFFINDNGYIVASNKASSPAAFGGWRVCLWNHGVPELFHNYKGYSDIVPPNCALTHLIPVYE